MNVTELLRPAFACALAAVVLLPACGGGDAGRAEAGTAGARPLNGVGSGGTGRTKSYALGSISGFGSIIVNGVHYDDDTATVVDDDGLPRTTADLRLGSEVEIDAGPITAGTAVASHIQISSDLIGIVDQAWDPATGMLRVLGQPVSIGSGTFLDAYPGGASGIPAGSLVEVSSVYDPKTGVYAATRIDPRLPVLVFKTRGAVDGLDAKRKTFRIGTQAFTYAGVANAPKLKNGQLVCVDQLLLRNAASQWVVTAFLAAPAPADGTHAEVAGVATAFVDATHFSVQGVAVDATGAKTKPAGAVVADGSTVSVKGTMAGGVLLADTVEIDGADDADSHGKGPGKSRAAATGAPVALTGPLLAAPDAQAQRFVVRGPTTVDYAGAAFAGGTAADLAAGRRIRLAGTLAADGTHVVAKEIRFLD